MYTPEEISDLLQDAVTQTEGDNGHLVLTFSNGETVVLSQEEWDSYNTFVTEALEEFQEALRFDEDHFFDEPFFDDDHT